MAGSRASAYRPYNPRWFNKLLRLSFGFYLGRRFRIHCTGTELFQTLKPPFVVLPNHVALLDALMVGSKVPRPIYWIASDGNMRTTFMRFVLKLVGTIPKSKYIPDLETINGIVEVVRKRGGVVGIFPEGTASFDGHTQELVPATGKLLKLLKVPVVTAVIKGAYYSMPRWSWTDRRGRIEIDFRLAIGADEIIQLKADQIFTRLREALEHDEADWESKSLVPYSAKARAENLQTVLFRCPICGNNESMRSDGPTLSCAACTATWHLDRFYRLKPLKGTQDSAQLETIREWNLWQSRTFKAALIQNLDRSAAPLFSDSVSAFRGRRLNPLRSLYTGQMTLYPDRLELEGSYRFPLAEIEGEGVLRKNILEFYHNRVLYQLRFPSRNASALKWLLSLGVLRERCLAAQRPSG